MGQPWALHNLPDRSVSRHPAQEPERDATPGMELTPTPGLDGVRSKGLSSIRVSSKPQSWSEQ